MTNLTEKIKTIRIPPVGIIAVLLGITLSLVFLWTYVNQYLVRSKAYQQGVNLAWTKLSLNIPSGGTGSISLQISTSNTAYKISAVDVTIKGDAKLQSLSYQSTTPPNYFETPVITRMTNNIYRLVLVSKKANAALLSGVIINLQATMRTGVSGTSILKIDTAPQVVGTPGDRQFNINTVLPLRATINITTASTVTPPVPTGEEPEEITPGPTSTTPEPTGEEPEE